MDPAKEPPATWAAWQQVGHLIGFSRADLTTSYAYTSDTSRKHENSEDHTTVFMEFARREPSEPGNQRQLTWRVTRAEAEATTHYQYASYSLGGGQWLGGEGVVQSTYAGPLSLRVDPTLWFSFETGVGDFLTLHEPVAAWPEESSGTVTEIDGTTGQPTVRAYADLSTRDPGLRPLENSLISFTAPKAAAPFSARFNLSDDTDQGRGHLRRTATVDVYPDWDDVEVVVDIAVLDQPPTSFPQWRPEGSVTDPARPGPRPLKISATLRLKDGVIGPLPEVRRFRFELLDTSREPGVCMNWPVPAKGDAPAEDPEFDLRFTSPSPEIAVLSPRRQKAGARPLPRVDSPLPSAWVTLECFDFGAHADLQVIAELVDERQVLGHLDLDGDTQYRIRLPHRPPNSRIARVWRDRYQLTAADDADEDDQPVGDGQKGDGFNNYEEYRGFRVAGAHVSPKPTVKDLFVRSTTEGPVSAACRSLEVNSAVDGREGLSIWDGLTEEEWHESRVMNLHRSASAPGAAKERQHGVLVEDSPADGPAIISRTRVVAEPPRPKNVTSLQVHLLDNTPQTIAHELAHAIGVEHHGEIDYYARWDVREVEQSGVGKIFRFTEQRLSVNSATGALTPFGVPYFIRVFDEGNTHEIRPVLDGSVSWPQTNYVAQRGGQNSGQQYCLLRYNNANAYIPKGRVTDRIRFRRPITVVLPGVNVYGLCRSCEGTGINPQRFGHAFLGNCLGQLCVRDSAPLHPAPTRQCPDTP